jgi:hypothetical protein
MDLSASVTESVCYWDPDTLVAVERTYYAGADSVDVDRISSM